MKFSTTGVRNQPLTGRGRFSGEKNRMHVPLLDLKRQLIPLRDEILAAVTEVIDSTQYIMGPRVESLEQNIADYSGTGNAIGVTSGTDAILASLMTLGVGHGDYVVTTPYTFFATVGCILRLGAIPIFADIDPATFNIDPDEIVKVLEENDAQSRPIKAIMPVHLYGQCADMQKILTIAGEYGVPVVEDAAQAIGACCPVAQDGKRIWKRAGSMGIAGCFSFFPSKNLGCIGDGGMVVSNDDVFSEALRIIRGHGGAPKYHHAVVGGNFRLDPIQAAVLDIKLKHLPQWHKDRRENAELYNGLFTESGLVDDGLIGLPVAMYRQAADEETELHDYHIYNQYVIRCRKRDELMEFLRQEDVGVEIYYPIPLHKQKCMEGVPLETVDFPESEKAALETLALPIYPELTDAMQVYVVEKIIEFYKK